MAVRQVNPRYDPPSTPWYKKALGLLSAVMKPLEFVPGVGIAAKGIGTGAQLGAALGPGGKGGKYNPVVKNPDPSGQGSGITGVAPPQQKPQESSALDKVTTVIDAIGDIGQVAKDAKNIKKEKGGDTTDQISQTALKYPQVADMLVLDALNVVEDPTQHRLLGGREIADQIRPVFLEYLNRRR